MQPEKSCSPLAHSCAVCAASRAALICTTASCISLPLCHSRCSCLFIQRLALRLSWTEKQSRSGRISMHPAGLLGRCVFCILAVPASPYFHVGNTNILWVSRFWWCRHIQIDFHTFHFSFLLTFCTCFLSLSANFLHLLFFLPANFLHLLFFPSIYFLEPTIYFLEPTIYCLFTSLTYMFNTFATTTWLFVATLFN